MYREVARSFGNRVRGPPRGGDPHRGSAGGRGRDPRQRAYHRLPDFCAGRERSFPGGIPDIKGSSLLLTHLDINKGQGHPFLYLFSFGLLLGFWMALSSLFGQRLAPTPLETLVCPGKMALTPEFWRHCMITVYRGVTAFSIALVGVTALGVACGSSRRAPPSSGSRWGSPGRTRADGRSRRIGSAARSRTLH